MLQVQVDVPDEVLYDTKMTTEEAEEFARQMVAIGYYTQNKVSLGYCAEIAGMTEEEFIQLLSQRQISIFQFDTADELRRDISNA